MVRWRCALLLATLLLLPAGIGGKMDEDDDDDNAEEDGVDNENDDDDEIEEPTAEKLEIEPVRMASTSISAPRTVPVTRTTIKRPLECYVCAYKADTPMKSCLDPIKYRVHTMTCHAMDDKCYMSVVSKSNSVEAVVRGCRSGCVGTQETNCCDLNRCNGQVFALPSISPRTHAANKTTKTIPTTILFFVTILLVLQTVVKVAFV